MDWVKTDTHTCFLHKFGVTCFPVCAALIKKLACAKKRGFPGTLYVQSNKTNMEFFLCIMVDIFLLLASIHSITLIP